MTPPTRSPRTATARAGRRGTRECALVADLGGSGLRVALVDEGGRIVAMRRGGEAPLAPGGDVAESDPQRWWQRFGAEVDALAAARPAAFGAVAAIAITGFTRTQVCLDRAGRVLRPALLWSDVRAAATLDTLRARCPLDHAETADLNPFHPLARLWWLRQREPRVADALACVVEPKDFLNLRLTGVVASDAVSTARLAACARPAADGRCLLDAAGLDASVVPPLRAPESIVGQVRTGLPGALGALAGVPVMTMAHDTWTGVVGLGAMRVGCAYDVSGTTEVLGLITDAPAQAEGLMSVDWGPGLQQLGGPSQTGADTLGWLLSLLGRGRAGTRPAAALERLLAMPRAASPALFLPFLGGERTPYWDASLRGALLGLDRRHRAVDLAWAVMEGVAYLNRVVLGRAEAATGVRAHELRFGGGGSANAHWCRVKADVLQRPVVVTDCAEHGLLGAAVVVWTGLGRHASLEAAQRTLVRDARRYEPDAATAARHNRVFDVFERAVAALRPVSHVLAAETGAPA